MVGASGGELGDRHQLMGVSWGKTTHNSARERYLLKVRGDMAITASFDKDNNGNKE